ncbi:hypothetical protein [uncultured Cocleimonas sp.]|uniref:hypothetical protein n=1 Tax=uncultured Cocleimonas sp. TaxID=1051587 RepID=UPI00260796FF|nr:hypothetical protein [uncultured Cocleimonas sp.]
MKLESWSKLNKIYDLKIFLKPDIDTVKTTLIDRWLDYGYDLEGAKQLALSNDIHNAEFIVEHSVEADLVTYRVIIKKVNLFRF